MDIDISTLTVEHNPDESRFEIKMPDGSLAMVEYILAKKNIVYTHTEVPTQYEGNGIAGKLASYVMDYAVEQGYKVQALCPYIKHYVSENKEYHEITWGF